MLKKALIYLGLGPDEEYEQYDEFAPAGPSAVGPTVEPVQVRAVANAPRPISASVRPVARKSGSGSVRAVPSQGSSRPGPTAAAARPVSPGTGHSEPAVRIVETTTAKPHAMSPTSFNEAQAIGDRFKSGQPVIVNLQGVERDLRRRLVDFASGLCYALGGKMDRVANQVYLLTPADVEVSSDDTRRALD